MFAREREWPVGSVRVRGFVGFECPRPPRLVAILFVGAVHAKLRFLPPLLLVAVGVAEFLIGALNLLDFGLLLWLESKMQANLSIGGIEAAKTLPLELFVTLRVKNSDTQDFPGMRIVSLTKKAELSLGSR